MGVADPALVCPCSTWGVGNLQTSHMKKSNIPRYLGALALGIIMATKDIRIGDWQLWAILIVFTLIVSYYEDA